MKDCKRQNYFPLAGTRLSDFKDSFAYEPVCFLNPHIKQHLNVKMCEDMNSEITDEELESIGNEIYF